MAGKDQHHIGSSIVFLTPEEHRKAHERTPREWRYNGRSWKRDKKRQSLKARAVRAWHRWTT